MQAQKQTTSRWQNQELPDVASCDAGFLAAYHEQLASGVLEEDPLQQQVVERLQMLHEAFTHQGDRYRKAWSNIVRLPHRSLRTSAPKGFYLWGGVGRGKTHLLNLFFQRLPLKQKLRLHFHRFMQLIHEELREIEGQPSPLNRVAERIAVQCRVLCLDEMQVTDITDAMLLGGLFQALLEKNVRLLITSNIKPERLYAGGLQRERFLPTIQLIEDQLETLHLDGGLDYRSRTLLSTASYFLTEPQGSMVDNPLQSLFYKLSGIRLHEGRNTLTINGREIPVLRWADDVAWFSFDALCNTPRTASDYLEISRYFKTVLISHIPIMQDAQLDQANRFIHMIDCFYDAHTYLAVSAQTRPDELYKGERLADRFLRAASRLKEMCSASYLASPGMVVET
jgi:cell division protein ZapE